VSPAYAAATAVAAFALGRAAPRPAPLGRVNYRSRAVSLSGGPVCVLVLLAGCAAARSAAAFVAVALCGAVGVYDDLRGTPAARGLRGHLGALRRGELTSGLVKLFVAGVAGVVAAALLWGASWRAASAAVVVAGLANLLNLLDLRPGRALKVALVCAVPVPGAVAGVAGGTALGLLWWDLRERLMLGDGGANALGAALGVALAAVLPAAWCAVAAAVVVALTLASERVSFTAVIERTPPLRWADSLGRRAA
jgi:UDP-N-acetylmuramyl pentapeptide phosphotransferase/UDP-N-acetylglucosamine-1-phosphate transferase